MIPIHIEDMFLVIETAGSTEVKLEPSTTPLSSKDNKMHTNCDCCLKLRDPR
jgi:hypothetical protein